MAETDIQWTWTQRADGTWAPGYTFNPWTRCTETSPACDNCYARTWANRAKHPVAPDGRALPLWGDDAPRDPTSASYWRRPLAWQRDAAAMGEYRKVFCASLADVFEDHPAITASGARERLWELIAKTPNLLWLLLTKRPENMLRMAPAAWANGWPRNVWAGTTAEDQKHADKRLPHLLLVPALHFVSVEPQLSRISLRQICGNGQRAYDALDGMWRYDDGEPVDGAVRGGRVSWVICGGESGNGARPFDVAWPRALRDECAATGAAFFMKQWGAKPIDDGRSIVLRDSHGGDMAEWHDDLRVRHTPPLPLLP